MEEVAEVQQRKVLQVCKIELRLKSFLCKGVVVLAYNPSTREAIASSRSVWAVKGAQGQLELYGETLPQKYICI